jgi:glycosyltransferase involved in cell wall biosynthesis
MKIVHLTSAHPIHDARILHKEAATLAAAGHEVVLVAAGEGDGAVIRGVQVRVVAHAGGGRPGRMTRTVWRVLRAAQAERADVYHFHDPELIPVGVWLKLLGRRVVYDVHEDLPAQILSKYWIRPALRRPVAFAVRLLEGAVSRLFDALVVANPAHAVRFPASRTVVVRNLPDLAEFPFAPALGASHVPVAIYVGALTRVRGALEMVRAMALLPPSCPARLWLGGRFSEPGLEAACRKEPGWSRVDFLGWLERGQLAERLGRARFGMVVLHPTPQHHTSYATKLFEYMSAGLPLVVSDLPINREIVDATRCGLVVDPLNPAAIARAIVWLLEHPAEAEAMGRRGRAAVEQRYNWQHEALALLALYERFRPRPRARPVAGLQPRP